MATGAALATELKEGEFRSHMGSISRQSSVYLAGIAFTTASGYFFKVYLARTLGADALGFYALGMTVVGFFGWFNNFGLTQSAVRFVASYVATGQYGLLRGFLARGLALLFVANLSFAILLVLVGPWVGTHFYHTSGLNPLMKWLALIMLCGALSGFLGQALAGFKQIALRTILASFIGSPLTIGITLALVGFGGMGLQGYVVAQALSAICVVLLLGVAVWRSAPLAVRSVTTAVSSLPREVMTFSAAMLGVGVLEYTLGQADAIMLGHFRSPHDVGIYAVATAMIAFVPILLQSTNQIFSPMISDLHSRGQISLLGRIFQTITKWVLGLTLPLVCCIAFFSHAMMRIFGAAFEPGWIILIIGAVAQLINCGVGPVGYLLLMSGHQKTLIQIEFAMALLMLALNRLLIPGWGLQGAAVAAAVTTVGTNAWCLCEVRRRIGIWPYNRSYWRLLLPSCAALGLVILVRIGLNSLRSGWFQIVIALTAAYVAFVCVSLFCGMDQDDRLIVDAVKYRLGWRGSVVESME